MQTQMILFGLISCLVACGEKEAEEIVPEEIEETVPKKQLKSL